MKRLPILILVLVATNAVCQSDKVLEKRAKDFHQAISKNDKDAWRKFMNENFTTDLIERPMRAQVSTSENDGTNANDNTTKRSDANLEAKLSMFQQLHEDFGKSKIASLKVSGSKVEMILRSDSGMNGVFTLEAESKSPWLLDKMGIEVEVGK